MAAHDFFLANVWSNARPQFALKIILPEDGSRFCAVSSKRHRNFRCHHQRCTTCWWFQPEKYDSFQVEKSPDQFKWSDRPLPVAIENIVGKTPQFFNFFSGGGLDPTTAYALDQEGENPFGGKPFPLKVHMELNLLEDDPGFVQATYISSLDKEKGVPILIEAVEKMLNEKFSEADQKMIGENVEVTNRADMRIRLSDGVVQFYKQTETKSIAGKKEVNLMEMTLLETP